MRHAFHWIREALLLPLDPGSTVVAMSSGAAVAGSPLSGGYAGAKATIRFITGYAPDESERAGLGIRFISVLPKLTPATDLGSAAVAAYARRDDLDVERVPRALRARPHARGGRQGHGRPGGLDRVRPGGLPADAGRADPASDERRRRVGWRRERGSPRAVRSRPKQLEPYRRELAGYCYRMLGSIYEAEDAVQDTMLRAWRALRPFEDRAGLRPGSTGSPPTSASTC